MPVPWNEDDPRDAVVIARNLSRILRQVARDASLRHSPTTSMVQEWHREIYQDVSLPVPYYAGEFRDSDPRFPQLIEYEVRVGRHEGVASRLVPRQLADFETSMRRAVNVLDSEIPIEKRPSTSAQGLSVLTLCAYAHGEWVRIHPFANGNGRTARLWANWCALRYSLPPFVRLKPRPEGNLYATASALSMTGNHQPMVAVFVEMLDRHLIGSSS